MNVEHSRDNDGGEIDRSSLNLQGISKIISISLTLIGNNWL